MATHSSVLAWRIPGKGEPGGLPSIELPRVGHYWSDLAAAAMPLCQRQKEKRVTENEMAGWHHWLNGNELGQTPNRKLEGRTGRPGVLQFIESQNVEHDLATEQQQMPLSSDYFSYLRHTCGIFKIVTHYLVLNMHLYIMQKLIKMNFILSSQKH